MDKQLPTKLASAVYKVTELFPQNEPLRYKTREIADEILADFVLFQDLEKQNTETEQGFLRRNRIKNQIFSKIEILNDYYFDLAREQAWVNPLNFLILKREYDKMKRDIKTQLAQIEFPETEPASAPAELRRGKPEPVPEQPSEPEPEQPKIEPIKPELEIEPEISTISDKPSVIVEEPVAAKGFGEAKPAFEPKPEAEVEPEPKPEPKFKKLSARHKEILKIIEQGGKKQVGEIRESFPSLSKRTLRRDLEFLLKQGYVDRVGQWNEVSYRIK